MCLITAECWGAGGVEEAFSCPEPGVLHVTSVVTVGAQVRDDAAGALAAQLPPLKEGPRVPDPTLLQQEDWSMAALLAAGGLVDGSCVWTHSACSRRSG